MDWYVYAAVVMLGLQGVVHVWAKHITHSRKRERELSTRGHTHALLHGTEGTAAGEARAGRWGEHAWNMLGAHRRSG